MGFFQEGFQEEAMQKSKRQSPANLPLLQVPLGLESFCREFAHSGAVYLDALTLAIEEAAPKPGRLVYLQAKKLAMRLNGLEPVLFSALDVNTHLQVARVYLTMTRAAAVDFVESAAQSFSFPILRVRSLAEAPFAPSAGNSVCDFTSAMNARGIEHSVLRNPSSDALFSLLTKLTFGGVPEQPLPTASKDGLQAELGRYLFFHNNYRKLPWLGGKTPLEKFNASRKSSKLRFFDPIGFSQAGRSREHAVQQFSIGRGTASALDNVLFGKEITSRKNPGSMKGRSHEACARH